MQKAKVATNPGPAALLVINPRGRKMATKRRRSTTAKRRTSTARRRKTTTPRVYASNPTRRRRASAAPRRARRRSVARRRNPATGGLIAQAAGLAAGITVVGLAQGFIPPLGGISPIAVAARQGATGWLIGEGMRRFGVMRNYSNDMKLAGLALGAGTLINAYVVPIFSGFLRPRAAVPVEGGNGVQGIAPIYRGFQPYRMYANNGMGGIAMIDPAQQPYGEYAS